VRRVFAVWLAVVAAASLGAWAQESDEPIIADLVVDGGVTLTQDTVIYYIGLEPGDPLDRLTISEGFRRLWDSGLVEDLTIEIEPLESGEVNLIVSVVERPFVTTVVFEGNKKLNTSTLKDRLDENNVDIPRNVPLKMPQLSKIKTTLEKVYAEEGYRSAIIDFEVEDLGRNRRRLQFNIQEGGKVTIDDIDFVGNEAISDSRLRGALKETKEKRFYRFFGDKIVYSEESWEEDRENLRKFYLDRGYIDIKVGQPQVELVAQRPNAETLKKKKFRAHITIPVEEGEPYAVGSLKVGGRRGLQRRHAGLDLRDQGGQDLLQQGHREGQRDCP
jgi:outer membrane protein insertion porin family